MAYKNTGICHSNSSSPSSQYIVGRDRLTWRSEGTQLSLYHGSNCRPLVGIEPDSKYPGMFRVRYPNGNLSGIVNLTRAKDAAAVFALRRLNPKPQETAAEHHTTRQKLDRASEQPRGRSRTPALRNGVLAVLGQEL